MKIFSSLVGAVGAAYVLSGTALAQTGPELLIKPWAKDGRVEVNASSSYIWDGTTDNQPAGGGEFDYELWQLDLSGRARIVLEPFVPVRADPRLGFDLTHMDLDTNDPSLPNQFTDTSIAFGMGVLEESGWLGGITVGIGYAAAGAFDDGNAWYGKADFAIGRTIDDTSEIGFVLDYDGNRTFLPDIPLPGVQYRKRLNPTLLLAVGFPFNSVEWKPNDQLTIEATYSFPDILTGNVTYQVTDTFGIFAAARSRSEAFHWDELPNDNDRLIFEQQAVEAGINIEPVEDLNIRLVGGYAFSQVFDVGFDTRDADEVAELSDEPYVRVGVEWRY